VLRLKGRLNATTAEMLENALERHWRNQTYRIVLDCAGLTYVSSAGLQVFLVASRIIEANHGRLVFARLSDFLGDAFSTTEFSRIFLVCASIPEAVSHCLDNP